MSLLKSRLKRLPAGPGVYLFRDTDGQVVYIGKAKSLRSRVRSYFQSNRTLDPKIDFIQKRAADLEWVVTDNEVEALILESNLVKQHQPILNARLKDDKSFLHIKLTVDEPYPRVLLTRRVLADGSRYFGPYLPASLARNLVKIINRHFLLRTCDIEIDGKLERPCLEYYIDRCLGPCVSGLCEPDRYRQAVADVILLLEGKNRKLLASLEAKMERASADRNYEAAAFFRDRIRMVRDIAERQKMMMRGVDDVDVFAYYREGPRLALQLFTLRDGRVVGKREFFWEDIEFFDPADFLRDALQQYYLGAAFLPNTIYLPVEIEDGEVIEQWLSQRREGRRKVRIVVPRRGGKHDLVVLVERNARIAFDARFRVGPASRRTVLERLQEALALPGLPDRIEAFDISNFQGSETVGSMVVSVDGRMDRSQYRRFKVREVDGPDDYAALLEVVRRRYRRLLREDKPLPALVLIDGGRGQLHAAYQALSDLGIEDLPLASLAKREELVFVQGQSEPIALARNSGALHLLQEIRDEAHRFAVTYHRNRRRSRDFASELDDIPGIGAKRKKRLLQNFGSLQRIRRASVEELTPFVGPKLAEVVKKHLGQ